MGRDCGAAGMQPAGPQSRLRARPLTLQSPEPRRIPTFSRLPSGVARQRLAKAASALPTRRCGAPIAPKE